MSSILVAFTVASAVLWAVLQMTSGRRRESGAILRDSPFRSILLADDSVTIRRVVETALEGSEIEVTTFEDGGSALEALESRDFDLVLTDLHMPGADGLAVCRKAKTLDPTRPVILIVGIFEPREAERLEDHGADHVLEKPFDDRELVDLVQRLGQAFQTPAEDA